MSTTHATGLTFGELREQWAMRDALAALMNDPVILWDLPAAPTGATRAAAAGAVRQEATGATTATARVRQGGTTAEQDDWDEVQEAAAWAALEDLAERNHEIALGQPFGR